jgi:Putative outer membrane beta-barrel porin, MtrB/PioB
VPRDWDGVSPITNPTDVNQLPARSPNAKVRNINQQYALVNRRSTFQFQAQYRSQSVDNQTPTIIFPGYAAFGDSTWRAARTDFFNLPIENLDWDFRRQNAEAGFKWDVLPSLTWKMDYEWEGWNRKFRDVNRNNDHSIRNRLDFEYNLSGGGKRSTAAPTTRPTVEGEPKSPTTLRLKLDYTYSNRRALVYNTQPLSFVANFAGSPVGGNTTAWVVVAPSAGNPGTVFNLGVPTEFNLLRRYDQSDRTRNDASFTVELLRGPSTSFSASYRYLGDEHDKNFYGRLFNRFAFVDVEFTHAFESGAFLYANYSRETNRYAYRDLAHLLPAANPLIQGVFSQFPIANTWERTSRSSLDSFEFGVNVAPQEGKLQNWQFDLAYAFSSTRDRISTLNPFTVRPDSVIHAGTNPYPDTVVRRQDVNLVVTRRITENYEIGVRYWYEPYTQDDFSYNVLQPYVHGNVTSDTPKYLFQDARYGSYHANVANVFLRYTF